MLIERVRSNKIAQEVLLGSSLLIGAACGNQGNENPQPTNIGGQSVAGATASPDRSAAASPSGTPKIGAPGAAGSPEVPNPSGFSGKGANPPTSETPKSTTTEIYNGACPKPETSLQTKEVADGLRVAGIPDKTGNVLDANTAKADDTAFSNTIQNGTEGFIAEPGGLLVGPDFESRSSANPNGNNPGGWEKMWTSKGFINPFEAETHEIIRQCPPIFQIVPTGGFMVLEGIKMTVEVGHSDDNGDWVSDGKKFTLDEKHNGTWFFAERGAFADMNVQNQDRNKIARITNYVAGALEIKMYKAGKNSNTAFISEGQFAQFVRDAHDGQTNCGTGCAEVRFVGHDINTDAVSYAKQVQGRNQNPKSGWSTVYRNW